MSSPPRTRPRNRRDSILRAAADLFSSEGYHSVSIEDIAAAVGVGASALYRHVRNKQELLELTLLAEFQPVRNALRAADPDDIASAIRVLAVAFGKRRQMGLLWSREVRHLDDDARARLREAFFEVRNTLVRLVPDRGRAGDPELVAMVLLAVLTSPGNHTTAMSNERMITLLVELCDRVISTPLPSHHGDPLAVQEGDGVASASRQVVIMTAATHLFSTRGYQNVTMKDIGLAVGVTSASLYRHFPTKGDLLTSITTRATDVLHVGLTRARATTDSPREALYAAVVSYVEFATHHHDLLGVLVTEMSNIPEPARLRLHSAQRAYVAEWFALQESASPKLDRAEARFRVHAALAIVNDAVRTVRLLQHPGVASNIIVLADAMLES